MVGKEYGCSCQKIGMKKIPRASRRRGEPAAFLPWFLDELSSKTIKNRLDRRKAVLAAT